MAVSRTDAREVRWDRWAPATGIAFVALAVIAFLLAPDTPNADDSNDEVFSYFTDKDTRILWGAFFFALSGVAFLWFFGTLASLLRRAEADPAGRLPAIMVTSAAASAGLFLAATGAYAALAAGADGNLNADSGRALFDLGNLAFVFTNVPASVLVAAASLGALRTAFLPAWLAWAGIGFFVLALVDLFGRLAVDSAAFGSGGIVGTIVFVVFLAWTLAASFLLTQRARGAAS
jgi:hypothetical protein